MENLIEVRDVYFSYERGEQAVCDVTLSIARGEYVGIIGPNGGGKTTLLKIMLGLLRPSVGAVRLFGANLNDFQGWSNIGYVAQKATNFDKNFPATAFEVVLMGRYARRGLFQSPRHEDKEIAEMALRHVGMGDQRDRLIGDLSGGQQQRIFIARALAAEPQIIFLDEPTAGVDRQTEEDFYALLRKLNQEMHLTLVLISHDVDIMTREASRIAFIDKKLKFYGTPAEFLKSDLAQEAKTYHPHHA